MKRDTLKYLKYLKVLVQELLLSIISISLFLSIMVYLEKIVCYKSYCIVVLPKVLRDLLHSIGYA